jgi:hypothetical protein
LVHTFNIMYYEQNEYQNVPIRTAVAKMSGSKVDLNHSIIYTLFLISW